jgi:hypothetical protein
MTRSYAKWWMSLVGAAVLATPLVSQAQSVRVEVSAPPPPRVEVRVPPPPQVVVTPPPPPRVVVAAPAPAPPPPPPRVVAAPPPPPRVVVAAPAPAPPAPVVHVTPPAIRFEAPPPLVAVQPGIQVVPDYDEEVFFAGGWYWMPGPDGVWFRTRTWRGGWEVAPRHVVPVALVRIPRGHYRRWHAAEKWREKQERREEKWRRKHGRW